MLSSTSSSNDRLPVERWGRVWATALILVAGLLGGWEAYLRSLGVLPSVASRTSLWVTTRARLRPTSTVAAGTSRMLSILDPDVWAADFGGAPAVQLSVLGGSSIRLLEHLAGASEFRGLVLADVVPFFTFDADSAPTRLVDDRTSAYLQARISPAQRIEAVLRTYVPGLVALRRQEVTPLLAAEAWRAGRRLTAPAVEVRTDGYAPLRFRAVGVEPNSARVLDPATFDRLRAVVPDSATFEGQLARLATAVDRIQARGGRVVLVYMPGCGGRRVVEERQFPKARFWEPVRRRVRGITLDLEDYPGFATLACFDGSHVDQEDAVRITVWLASQIKSRLGDAGGPAAPPG